MAPPPRESRRTSAGGKQRQNQEPVGLLSGVTVLSLEQAVALPYATWRLALEGARVIRVEPLWGDPNRKVGPAIVEGDDGYSAYFIAVNTCKESITLNLAQSEGQKLLGELIVELGVDVFANNQIPTNYAKLGLDYQRLSGLKPDLIWVGVSGFGPGRSQAAYDPMVQAYSGLAATNGEPGSPPLKFGVSIADFEAANQAYTEVCKALWRRDRTGRGANIEVSLLDCCLSLLALHIGMESLGHSQAKAGNSHPVFAPVGAYPTADGHLSLATGNEAQWRALVSLPGCEGFDRPEYATNNQRRARKERLDKELSECFSRYTTAELVKELTALKVPAAPVHTLGDTLTVPDLAQRLLHLSDPSAGLDLALAPPPVRPEVLPELTPPPRLGAQNEQVFGELGYDVEGLRGRGLIT